MFDWDWGSIIGAGSQIIGGVLAKDAAASTRDAAAQTTEASTARLAKTDARVDEALATLRSLTPPNLLALVEPFQRAVVVGQLTPEEATFQMQKATEQAGIRVPPELISAQQNALTRISQIANEGGITAIDRARLNNIRDEQDTIARGNSEAILQNAQQRGVAGSGVELASRMLNQQASATRSSRAGVDVAAEAQRRALEAITQQGTLAGSMRSQDVAEQQKVADAQDAINRFNTSFQNSTNAANVGTRNAAAAGNLAEKQRVADFNIGQREREAATRMTATQNQWTNALNQNTNVANLSAGQASGAIAANTAANTSAANQNALADGKTAAAYQSLGSGIGSLVDAFGNKKKEGP